MKRITGLILAAAVAAGLFWFASNEQALETDVHPSALDTVSEPLPDSAPPANGRTMTVSYVHDGDTLFLTAADGSREKVRLIGVDAPELQPSEECYAGAARDYLRHLTPEGSTVRVAADLEAQDHYGRSLYYLWTADGVLVNLTLVAEGYGTALKVEPNAAYWDELLAAEALAKSTSAGLWAEC